MIYTRFFNQSNKLMDYLYVNKIKTNNNSKIIKKLLFLEALTALFKHLPGNSILETAVKLNLEMLVFFYCLPSILLTELQCVESPHFFLALGRCPMVACAIESQKNCSKPSCAVLRTSSSFKIQTHLMLF